MSTTIKDNLRLLRYHQQRTNQDNNPIFAGAHEIIAYELEYNLLHGYNSYVEKCKDLGIEYYTEECFNDYKSTINLIQQ